VPNRLSAGWTEMTIFGAEMTKIPTQWGPDREQNTELFKCIPKCLTNKNKGTTDISNLNVSCVIQV
jgi:hypothetical protein